MIRGSPPVEPFMFRTPAIALLLAVSATAQTCSDPATPVAGFAVATTSNVVLVCTDGYQLRYDVRRPTAAPGPCGWPLVVFVHDEAGAKEDLAAAAFAAARRGYCAVAYDVRGQGGSFALNSGATYGYGLLSLRDRMDLFEVAEAAAATIPGVADLSRFGVAGAGQGGRHAWAAAAHSGRLPPANPWRTAAFPAVAAAVAFDAVPDLLADALPGGVAASHALVRAAFGTTGGVHLLPSLQAALQASLGVEDYAATAAVLAASGPSLLADLATSTVPVLAAVSYDDLRTDSGLLASTWPPLPGTTPAQLVLSTGGGGTPDNVPEAERRRTLRARWFERFLKGAPNGVETEPAVRAALLPASIPDYRATNTLYDFREGSAWPPAAETPTRFYLAGSGALSATAPATPGGDAVVHDVPAGATLAAYGVAAPTPAAFLATTPLSSLAYDAAPSTADRLLLGDVVARLVVDTPAAAWQVHAALFDVPPSGPERYVAGGVATVRGAPVAGPQPIDVRLSSAGYVLRAGRTLRLRVENVAWRRPVVGGGASVFSAAPVFADFALDVRRDPAQPSYVDVPFRAFGGPTLNTYPLEQFSALMLDQPLAVRSDASRAGYGFATVIGTSGTSPGTYVDTLLIPINADPWTFLPLNFPNQWPFLNFFGALDAEGAAYPLVLIGGFDLSAFATGRMSFATLIYAPDLSVIEVTNPVSVDFTL
jgi:predicted acyl esterase